MSFSDLCQSLWAMFVDFINSMTMAIFDLVDAIMVPICQELPQLDYEAAFLVEVCGLANKFLALDYGIYLFMSYVLFCFSVLLVKWVLGLIPFVE